MRQHRALVDRALVGDFAAVVLTEPPNIDRGEVTDKGSINQRAVLTHRAAVLDAMYDAPDASVIIPNPHRTG